MTFLCRNCFSPTDDQYLGYWSTLAKKEVDGAISKPATSSKLISRRPGINVLQTKFTALTMREL